VFWLFYLIGLIVFGSLALVVRVLKFLASVLRRSRVPYTVQVRR